MAGVLVDQSKLGEVLSKAWIDQGDCREYHPDANWFPTQGKRLAAKTLRAVEICQGCPVQQECLAFALLIEQHRDRGIWGGLTHRQRVALRVQLLREGKLPIVRQCAICQGWFTVASPNVHRSGQCCSRECRLAQQRRSARTSSVAS